MAALKVVVVGCGGMSNPWIKTLKEEPRVEIAGLVDIRREVAEEQARKFELSNAVVGDDYKKVLRKVKPQFVVDVTVPAAHKDVTITALKKGCHVLGEKPLADSMANAKKMLAAAKATGKVHMVSQNRRWIPAVRAIRKAVADGMLGTVSTINADFYLGAHFDGFRVEMEHPLLLDMSIHHFDLMRCMLSDAAPRAVYCHAFNPKGSWYKHEVAASAIYEVERDITFTYRGSWCAEGHMNSWNSDWHIIGEKGSIRWDEGAHQVPTARLAKPCDESVRKFVSTSEEKPLPLEPGDGNQAGSLMRFLEAIEKGLQPESNCFDNLKSLAMVFGAIQSHAKKARVAIEA
jgi:predicted dehydrogenase